MHQQELLEFRVQTKKTIHECLARDEVLDAVQHAHALGVNDGRLTLLREDLATLDQLGTSLVRAIGVWSRRFGHLACDIEKSPESQYHGIRPRAVFVWMGRDVVERIQTESEALSSGNPNAVGDWEVTPENLGSEIKDGNMPTPGAPGFRKAMPDKFIPPPLVSLAMVSQKFEVSDVLHEGPPPNWYQPRIAKAGIAAIRRGIPCGGGDKRI
jgi:hypothetical protein